MADNGSLFRAKRGDRIKVLIWDRTGMVLVYKRLEGAKFVWPQVQDGLMKMSPAQFSALFGGSTGASSGPSWRDSAERRRGPVVWRGVRAIYMLDSTHE